MKTKKEKMDWIYWADMCSNALLVLAVGLMAILVSVTMHNILCTYPKNKENEKTVCKMTIITQTAINTTFMEFKSLSDCNYYLSDYGYKFKTPRKVDASWIGSCVQGGKVL